MALNRAWGIMERTNTARRAPWMGMFSTNRPRPASSLASSERFTDRPTAGSLVEA